MATLWGRRPRPASTGHGGGCIGALSHLPKFLFSGEKHTSGPQLGLLQLGTEPWRLDPRASKTKVRPAWWLAGILPQLADGHLLCAHGRVRPHSRETSLSLSTLLVWQSHRPTCRVHPVTSPDPGSFRLGVRASTRESGIRPQQPENK